MRRVQRDATKEEFIQQIIDNKTGYFGEIWRLLLFAALLGKAKGHREPLEKVDTGKSIDAHIFKTSPLWPGIIHLLGVIEHGSSECLRKENWENSLKLFEEYANGGLALLSEELGERATSMEAIVNFLLSDEQGRAGEIKADISTIRL